MYIIRSTSLSKNPKILNNYLNFTENNTSNVKKPPQTSVSSQPWANNRNGIPDLKLSIKFPPIIWLLDRGRLGVGGTETDGDLFGPFQTFSSSLSIKFPPTFLILGRGRLGVGGTEIDGRFLTTIWPLQKTIIAIFFSSSFSIKFPLIFLILGRGWAAGSGRDRNRWGPALTSQSRDSVRQDSSLDSYLQIFRTCFQVLHKLCSRNAGTRISDTCIFFSQKWGCPYPLPHILDNAQISVVKINDRGERVSVQLCVNVMSLGYLQ